MMLANAPFPEYQVKGKFKTLYVKGMKNKMGDTPTPNGKSLRNDYSINPIRIINIFELNSEPNLVFCLHYDLTNNIFCSSEFRLYEKANVFATNWLTAEQNTIQEIVNNMEN